MKPAKYTRKLSRKNCRNPNKELAIDFHRVLNRIDVEKDATQTAIPIRDKTVFHRHADELFGPLLASTYSDSLAMMKRIVAIYKSERASLQEVTKYKEVKSANIVPPYITIGVQDAGISPTTYNPAIQLLVTPASYIDRCDRSKGSLFYGFDRPLVERDFKELAMATHLKHLVPTRHLDGSCTIRIESPGSSVETVFNTSYKPVSGDIEYFKGNATKNTWFNSNGVDQTNAYTYILMKELGDTLQAYYAHLYIGTRDDKREVCLFTNDDILAMRCQLLFVPVVYNVNADKDTKLFYYYPVMDSIRADFIDMYKSHVRIKNDSCIEKITYVLSNRYCIYPNGRMLRFTNDSYFAKVLQNCIKEIRSKTDAFETYPVDKYALNQVRKLSEFFQAVYIFNEKGVINTAARGLFISPSKGTTIFHDPWGAVVKQLILHQSGGGPGDKVEIAPPPYAIPSYLEVKEDELPPPETCRALHSCFLELYPEKPIDEIYAHVDNINGMFLCYFGYTASSSSLNAFLVDIVDMYMRGTLWMSYTEFESMYNEWFAEYDRMHPPEFPSLIDPPGPTPMDDVIADLQAWFAPKTAVAPKAANAVAPNASMATTMPVPTVLAYGGKRRKTYKRPRIPSESK